MCFIISFSSLDLVLPPHQVMFVAGHPVIQHHAVVLDQASCCHQEYHRQHGATSTNQHTRKVT